MVNSGPVNSEPQLVGYGFNLGVVYAVWVLVLLMLYPLCKKFDAYKHANGNNKKWLSCL